MKLVKINSSKQVLILFIIIFSCVLCKDPAPVVFAHQYGDETMERIPALLESGEMEQVRDIISSEKNKAYACKAQSYLAFYTGNYTEAVEWMLKALQHNPHDQSAANTVRYYTAVRDNAEGFVEKQSEHFIIRTKGKDIILQDYALSCMEKTYVSLGKIFKHYPEEKIIIEVFSDKDQFSIASTLSRETLKRSGAIGICKFHRLMILSPRALLMGYRWMDALSHEFTHMMINHVSNFNTPLWLHEGTARYYELSWRSEPGKPIEYITPGAYAQLMEAVQTDTLIPFKRMHPSMVYLKNQDEVSLAFSEVSSMVNFIISKYGDDAVIKILKGFENNTHNKSFKKVLGKNAFAFEKIWKKYMKKLPFEKNKGALTEKYIFDTSANEIEEFVGADAQGHVRLGDKFRKKKRFKVALLQYKDALKEEPENPVILVKLARCLISLNKEKEAQEKLTLSIAKNPNYVTAYVLLADLLYKEEVFKEALSYYKEANAINPFNPHIHKNMGIIYRELSKKDLAIEELSIAVILLPADIEIQTLIHSLQ